MGALRKIFRIGMLITIICICVIYYVKSGVNVTRTSDLKRMQELSDVMNYDVVSENMLDCDICTFSNIILKMQTDGYKISKEENTDKYIDIILEKDNVKYRMLYKSNRSLVSIASVYEKSYVPLTYIFEE